MTLTNLSRVFLLFCCVALASCSTMPSDRTGPENAFSADAIWIDVRTVEEYSNDHIEGDLNAPIQSLDVATLASQLGLERDSEIRFYCASGGRAGRAQAMFEEAGFTNVSNAGGIEDAREQRQLK